MLGGTLEIPLRNREGSGAGRVVAATVLDTERNSATEQTQRHA